MRFSEEQERRLGALGATDEMLQADFPGEKERNRAYQRLESGLAAEQVQRLERFCEGPRRPLLLELEERLSAALRETGFLQVRTPIILSRARLEKMGVFEGSIMEKQVFWLDAKRCLRPMLAPHLYEYMREIGRLRPRPIRLFEIGPCFRRETQGQRHANEFTMLNLVEMGLPEGTDLTAHLRELGTLVLDAAGVSGWRMTDEDSTVYGETSDFVDKNGMELASSALGPHPLDAAWGIMENWVGVGFGLERLSMAVSGERNIAKVGPSLSYLDGIRLRV